MTNFAFVIDASMPLVSRSDHKPPFWLPNGHFQSIYPSLFRVIDDVRYQRERIVTSDGDFLDLDWAFASGEGSSRAGRLVILSHGLEGSSSSQYIRGMVRMLIKNGFDCLSWNFRSCSGEMNQTFRFYHSGATEDLDAVVCHARATGYSHIQMMGFSLGGNLTIKYLGEQGRKIHSEIKNGIAFCVPMDLKACSMEINKPWNSVYMRRFLKTLLAKVREKSTFYPEKISLKEYARVKTLYDFDHIYTAAIHGFGSADDYYHKCSSMHFVGDIEVPTLIVNTKNDPMVPHASLPLHKIGKLDHVWLETSPQGGHCGFRPARVWEGLYWSEKRALEFLESGSV
jgi:predicted alpha/beta-fold hydrolase